MPVCVYGAIDRGYMGLILYSRIVRLLGLENKLTLINLKPLLFSLSHANAHKREEQKLLSLLSAFLPRYALKLENSHCLLDISDCNDKNEKCKVKRKR